MKSGHENNISVEMQCVWRDLLVHPGNTLDSIHDGLGATAVLAEV